MQAWPEPGHADQQANGEADLHRLIAAAEAVQGADQVDGEAGCGEAEGLQAFGEVGDGVDAAVAAASERHWRQNKGFFYLSVLLQNFVF